MLLLRFAVKKRKVCHTLRAAFRWLRGRFLMLFPNSQPNKTQRNHFIAHHLPLAGGGKYFHPFLPSMKSTHPVFLQSAATLPALPSSPLPLGHHPLVGDCPFVVGRMVVDCPLLAYLWNASGNKSSNHHWARDNPALVCLRIIPFRSQHTLLVSSTQTLLLPLFPTFLLVRFRL